MPTNFLNGGIILMLSGAVLAALRKVPSQILAWIYRQFCINIEVPSNSPFHSWALEWLASRPYSNTARNLSVVLKSDLRVGLQADPSEPSQTPDNSPIRVIPGFGQHFFRYRGTLLWVSRGLKEGSNNSNPRETLNLRLLGRSRELAVSLLSDIETSAKENTGAVRVYSNHYDGWSAPRNQRSRSLDSVVWTNSRLQELRDDCKAFFDSSAWYTERGIPHRRGYLLEGPPGGGKTSAILALASDLKLPVYTISLQSMDVNDSNLAQMLRLQPDRSFLVFEDIDACFDGRKKAADSVKVTFSGLLNAIDGVASSSGVIMFMTTNHPEKLDPALTRAGRCDQKIHVGYADQDQMKRLFLHFYPGVPEDQARQFASLIPAGVFSMASIQGHFLNHKTDPAGAIKDINALLSSLNKPKESEPETALEQAA
jgi:chaperone BCS1